MPYGSLSDPRSTPRARRAPRRRRPRPRGDDAPEAQGHGPWGCSFDRLRPAVTQQDVTLLGRGRCQDPDTGGRQRGADTVRPDERAVSYTHLRAHETDSYL